MPDFRGYRYEVKEVGGTFQGLVWPPGTPHATPGLQIVPRAAIAAAAEWLVKEWIDGDLGKNAGVH